MRVRLEPVTVPATEEENYDQKFFVCDFCEFEDTDEDTVKAHHGKTHAVKKTFEIGAETFRWFDSKEDAELYLDPPGDYSIVGFTYCEWTGPGWYGSDTVDVVGRCRCGGCHDLETRLEPIAAYIDEWKTHISTSERSIEGAKAKIAEAEALLTTTSSPTEPTSPTEGNAP